MNQKKLLKAANSKGELAKACLMYQHALFFYANESNWGVKEGVIQWLGSDDPTEVAQVVLGMRKKSIVRLPDKIKPTAKDTITPLPKLEEVSDAK